MALNGQRCRSERVITRPEAAAAARRRRRRGRGRRRRDAVVGGPDLQPAVRQSQRRRRRADHPGARQRRHSLQARGRRSARSACPPSSSPRRVSSSPRRACRKAAAASNAMTKDPGFGVSAFMENARYQHALETELARTIASLQNVQGARVHLAMARQSAFVSDRRPGSARRCSCRSRPGRRLEDEQVQAIANLVASSIPELEASQVTVVDQPGRLLSAPETDSDTRRCATRCSSSRIASKKATRSASRRC